MAMLAEPRRRQKLSFDPRNKSWSDDSTKFGQRLMEKMGWSKGRGLGAREDGNLDHIKVSLKNNNLGVGCTASHEDNWIAHQDDFNDILASLSQNHTSTCATDDAEKGASSLEERSKKSRKRVHYKKFTKGKDLTTYGKEGMNSILGKRLSQSAPVTPQLQSVENSEEENEDEGTTNASHGVITIKSSCSVSEYFAKKMADLKQSRRRRESESHSDGEVEVPRSGFGLYPVQVRGQSFQARAREEEAEETEEVRMGFGFSSQSETKTGADERHKAPHDDTIPRTGFGFVTAQVDTGVLVESKNSKDISHKICQIGDNKGDKEDNDQIESRDGKRKKKRKRGKNRGLNIENGFDRVNEQRQGVRVEVNCDNEEDEGIEIERKKKKNKKKRRLVDESVESESSDSASQRDDVSTGVEKKKKKKTKKSKKDKIRDEVRVTNDSEDMDECRRGNDRNCSESRKNRKRVSHQGEFVEDERDGGESNSCKKKRKKDKSAKTRLTGDLDQSGSQSIKKKGKKSRKKYETL